MSLFDDHLNRLVKSGMLTDFNNTSFTQNVRKNFTNPADNLGLYGLRGGGLQTNKNNPLLSSNKGLGGDEQLLKQSSAIQDEIASMDNMPKTEEVPEESTSSPKTDLSIKTSSMSGSFQPINSSNILLGPQRTKGKTSTKVEDPKEVSKEVSKDPSESKTVEPETTKDNTYNISDFGKAYTKNAPRFLMFIDNQDNKTFYKSKSDFLKKTKKRITNNFMKIGDSHKFKDEGIVVGVTKEFVEANEKN